MESFEVLPTPPTKQRYESPKVCSLGQLNTLIRGSGSSDFDSNAPSGPPSCGGGNEIDLNGDCL